jgi:hypothetical protein
MELDKMNTGFKTGIAMVTGTLFVVPSLSVAQPANPWSAAPGVIAQPVAPMPPTPKVMPKYLAEVPAKPFNEVSAVTNVAPEPSRFAPADLGRQLAAVASQPAPPPRAFGSVTQGQTPVQPVQQQQSVYNTVAPGAYAAPPGYGYAGAPAGYNNGYYPSQPQGSNGFPWGGGNTWPSPGNIPFGGSPNFGFW